MSILCKMEALRSSTRLQQCLTYLLLLLANSLSFSDVLYRSGNEATPLPEFRWISVGKCLNLTRIQKTPVQDINLALSLNHAELVLLI